MNNDELKRSNLYTLYMIIGALYVIVKILFVFSGYLHKGAILHGLVPAIITILFAVLALKKSGIFDKIIILLPILIFIITPIYMYLKQQNEWLTNGRLEVLILYEVMAVIQIIIAIKQYKLNK